MPSSRVNTLFGQPNTHAFPGELDWRLTLADQITRDCRGGLLRPVGVDDWGCLGVLQGQAWGKFTEAQSGEDAVYYVGPEKVAGGSGVPGGA